MMDKHLTPGEVAKFARSRNRIGLASLMRVAEALPCHACRFMATSEVLLAAIEKGGVDPQVSWPIMSPRYLQWIANMRPAPDEDVTHHGGPSET